MNDSSKSVFSRYVADIPEPERLPEDTTKQKRTQSIERLLNWLTHSWPESQITMRQICDWGPYPLRNKPKAVVDLARDLEAKGWLVPLRPRRHDSRAWKIGFKSNSAR
jgi:hypothetical protein